MGILIGMDEAGYGPQLGPLVVAGTAWEVPDETLTLAHNLSPDGEVASATGSPAHHTAVATRTPRSKAKKPTDEFDLYRQLRGVISKTASDRRIAVADSKALYNSGQGFRQLERGLHSVLLSLRQSLGRWSQIVDYCQADPNNVHHCHCWPEGHDCKLPVDAPGEELERLAQRLERACNAAGVRPLAIRARLVFPAEFNDLCAQYNSKGEALSNITITLLREVTAAAYLNHSRAGLSPAPAFPTSAPTVPNPAGVGDDPAREMYSPPPATCPLLPAPSISAVCDKHGGRNFYGALLQHHFPDHWVEAVHESHSESRYAWGPPESRVRVKFRTNGETFLPTALASMTAKYLRELAMRAFNQFWSAHLPNLRPTAGYYRDANRFRNDIAAKQRELGIDDHVMWRVR